RYSLSFWERRFGKGGVVLYERAQGIDARQVEPVRAPKSESAETTFAEDTRDLAFLKSWLFRHADRVGRSLRKHGLQGRIVTLKIKYADFRQLTRRVSLPAPTCATETLYETACTLLDGITLENKVRLIGVGVSGFDNVSQQLLLPMENTLQDERRTRLDKTLDALQGRYGKNVIVPGRLFNKQQKDADE
ncbi:MAG: DNA polymerase IV, partial [Bilophila sp.]